MTRRVQRTNSLRVEQRRMWRCIWLVRMLYIDEEGRNEEGWGYCTLSTMSRGGWSFLSYMVVCSNPGPGLSG